MQPYVEKITQNQLNPKQVGQTADALSQLNQHRVEVAKSMVITSHWISSLFRHNPGTFRSILDLEKEANVLSSQQLRQISQAINQTIDKLNYTQELAQEIIKPIIKYLGHGPYELIPSAVDNNLPEFDWIKYYEQPIRATGDADLLEKIKSGLKLYFTPSAITHRARYQTRLVDAYLPLVIVDLRRVQATGLLTTINEKSGQKNEIVIEAVEGLADEVFQGKLDPDQYIVDRNGWHIREKIIYKQSLYRSSNQPFNLNKKWFSRKSQTLSDKQIIELAKLGAKVHQALFYQQEFYWLLRDGKFEVLHTQELDPINLTTTATAIANQKHTAAGMGLVPGEFYGEVRSWKPGDKFRDMIIIAENLSDDLLADPPEFRGVIAKHGSYHAHAAVAFRKLGIPVIVGLGEQINQIKVGGHYTIDGDSGNIYLGKLQPKQSSSTSPLTREFAVINQPKIEHPSCLQIYQPSGSKIKLTDFNQAPIVWLKSIADLDPNLKQMSQSGNKTWELILGVDGDSLDQSSYQSKLRSLEYKYGLSIDLYLVVESMYQLIQLNQEPLSGVVVNLNQLFGREYGKTKPNLDRYQELLSNIQRIWAYRSRLVVDLSDMDRVTVASLIDHSVWEKALPIFNHQFIHSRI